MGPPRTRGGNRGNRSRRGTNQSQSFSIQSLDRQHSFRSRSQSTKRPRTDDTSASDISDFLDNVSKDENSLKTLVSELFKNQTIKNVLVSNFQSEITETLVKRIDQLEDRIDEMEQYSRRTCLKFCGVPESNGDHEDTDVIILNIINNDILQQSVTRLTLDNIGRSHRLGPKKAGTTRNIIVRFISYRHRALVYSNKRHLKNRNISSRNKIFVNEALTQKRMKLFNKTRQLYSDKLIRNCWTYDGRIFVRNLDDTQTVPIRSESDLLPFLNIRIPATHDLPSAARRAPHYMDTSLNTSENILLRPLDNDLVTSTPATTTT